MRKSWAFHSGAFAVLAFALAAGADDAHAITVTPGFSDDFETAATIPSNIWHGGRFDQGGGSIASDVAVVGNNNHTARIRDGGGLLLEIDTSGLSDVTITFDWRSRPNNSTGSFVVGYYSAPTGSTHLPDDPGLAGFSGLEHDFVSDLGGASNAQQWWASSWSQLQNATNNAWQRAVSHTIQLQPGQSQLWLAFWHSGSGNSRLDNVSVAGTSSPIPEPATVVLGLVCVAAFAWTRRGRRPGCS